MQENSKIPYYAKSLLEELVKYKGDDLDILLALSLSKKNEKGFRIYNIRVCNHDKLKEI